MLSKFSGMAPFKYYWFGVIAISIIDLFFLIIIRDASQCSTGWLGHLASLFNNIPEVQNADREGGIKCLTSLCYGMSLMFSPIFGFFINFCAIDFEKIEKFIESKSSLGVVLSWIFMLLLSVSPFTFGNQISLSNQFSYWFFGAVFGCRYLTCIYSILFLIAFSFIWFYVFYLVLRLPRRKL